MRIGIIAIGSQGDVRPFTALGAGLSAAGYEVRIISHASYETLARARGLEYAVVSGNPLEIVQGQGGQAWLESTNNSGRFMMRLFQIAGGIIDDLSRDMLEGARGCDLLIYSLPLSVMGYSVAEALAIPGIPASLYPLHPTTAYPSILTPGIPPRFGALNYLSSAAVAGAFWTIFRAYHNRFRRRELGLRGLGLRTPIAQTRKGRGLYLYGYSPSLLPPPPAWPDTLAVCGYWFLEEDAGYTPPPELSAFLEAGPPPLYVGFGSMASSDSGRLTTAVLEALRVTGRRAILARGWGGLTPDALPSSILQVDFVPHTWLFPRVAGAIHHGGAGTTAAAIRAGTPSIIVPFFADQFFWGRLVAARGLGSEPIPRDRLSAEALAEAIDSIAEGSGTSARCSRAAAQLGAEDGVGRAVEAVGSYLGTTARRTIA